MPSLSEQFPEEPPLFTEEPVAAPAARTARRQSTESVDRLPPHSAEAERGILGCCIIAGSEAFDSAVNAGITAADFYDLRHAAIWEACGALVNRRVPVDLLTLHQELRDSGQIDAVGGLTYINQIADSVPSASNVDYYAAIVSEKSTARKTIKVCADLIRTITEDQGSDPGALLDIAEAAIIGIRSSKPSISMSMPDLVCRAIDVLERRRAGEVMGVSTGLPDLDRALSGGIGKSEVCVLAARPGAGKTALALNIAMSAARAIKADPSRNGEHVLFLTLEMTGVSLTLRMIAATSGVNTKSIAYLPDGCSETEALSKACAEVSALPIIVDDATGLPVSTLRARARRLAATRNVKFIVVDYLQLIATEPGSREQREQQVAGMSRGIKSLAKELNIPILLLAQLNRDIERDKVRKPRLSDLRESGAIEADADQVIMLHYEDKDADLPDPLEVSAFVAKNRDGSSKDDVHLMFFRSTQKFGSKARPLPGDGVVIPKDAYAGRRKQRESNN